MATRFLRFNNSCAQVKTTAYLHNQIPAPNAMLKNRSQRLNKTRAKHKTTSQAKPDLSASSNAPGQNDSVSLKTDLTLKVTDLSLNSIISQRSKCYSRVVLIGLEELAGRILEEISSCLEYVVGECKRQRLDKLERRRFEVPLEFQSMEFTLIFQQMLSSKYISRQLVLQQFIYFSRWLQ
ncbi:hypothetical protein F511_44328 [Dorcoceras hygrometricum]|uniref:Uncharacterized protein n=1 Tax=Dorcoceras hygrometricum TaxID=472368 RepID=A0A2Z7B0L6_9LAMI|nr:hypothetical protein F511_44328 [Dorcoceras hygrometricum]